MLTSPGEVAAALAALGVGVGGLYLAPHGARWPSARALERSCARRRALVLTYDDGPSPATTPHLLALLRSRRVKATFFLVGMRVERSPELVDLIAAEGHEVGCHTHRHLHAWKVAPWQAVRDIRRGYETLRPWVGPQGLFRPPYGKVNLATWIELRRRGARVCWWTADSGDTHVKLPPPERVVEQVIRAGGGVVLLHDMDRIRDTEERLRYVLRATELLLDAAGREGFGIETLGQVVG